MKCPVDGNVLEQYTLDSVEVEKCPKCQGLWFTRGEIRQAEEVEGVDEDWLGFDLWSDPDAFEAEKSSRKCPICDQNMATILYGHSEVKIDYCVAEHGIWLVKASLKVSLTPYGRSFSLKVCPNMFHSL